MSQALGNSRRSGARRCRNCRPWSSKIIAPTHISRMVNTSTTVLVGLPQTDLRSSGHLGTDGSGLATGGPAGDGDAYPVSITAFSVRLPPCPLWTRRVGRLGPFGDDGLTRCL